MNTKTKKACTQCWTETIGPVHEDTLMIPHHCALHAAASEMFDLLLGLAKTACLKQTNGNKCICFSCEAKKLVAKAEGGK